MVNGRAITITTASLNASSYLVIKNTLKVGWVSNFWGAVQISPGFSIGFSGFLETETSNLRLKYLEKESENAARCRVEVD